MSKELTPLESYRNIFNYLAEDTKKEYKVDLKIIEKALKNDDKEKFDLIEQVRKLKDEVASLKSFNSKLWVEREESKEKLKALEIIKEKRVDIRYLQECESLEQYNKMIEMNWNDKKEAEYHNEIITQEQFDLLKEVLKCE